MSNLIGNFRLDKGQHRLFEPLLTFVTLYECVGVALAYVATGGAKLDPGGAGLAASSQFDLQVKHPHGALIRHALYGPPVVSFPINIEPKGLPNLPHETSAFQEIVTSVIAPVFVNYYESRAEWLVANVSTDVYQWPAVWNFARVVRNAATHGYNVNWRNTKAPAVKWHHLSYSAADDGRRLIGGDLILGDLLILMFEMDSELDRLGCPI